MLVNYCILESVPETGLVLEMDIEMENGVLEPYGMHCKHDYQLCH